MVTIAMSSETQCRRRSATWSAYPLLRLREMRVDGRSRDSSKCSSDHRLSRHCRVDEREDGSRRSCSSQLMRSVRAGIDLSHFDDTRTLD